MNKSPWLEELDSNWETHILDKDLTTDIVVVGSGIAGVSTTYFLLKYTNKKIVVLEKNLIARGASGYNAGLLVAEFERSLFDIAKEYTPELAISAQKEIGNGWNLLEEILKDIDVKIDIPIFKGYGGLRTNKDILTEIQNVFIKKSHDIECDKIMIRDDIDASFIPEEYSDSFEKKSKKEILEKLKTNNEEYIAATSNKWGLSNSALLCSKIMDFMLEKNSNRLSYFENTKVNKISFSESGALLNANDHLVNCSKVVLCTNGFENLVIENAGGDINTKFHNYISGTIGYMFAYRENFSPASGNFYDVNTKTIGQSSEPENFESIDPYLYVSRRPVGEESLVCIGGPEEALNESSFYYSEKNYPENKLSDIKEMMLQTQGVNIEKKEKTYKWHGLMGYTPNGIRMVGAEPLNRNLLYNIGCNGIGLLPSIAGAKRISRIISGENIPPSLFDPK